MKILRWFESCPRPAQLLMAVGFTISLSLAFDGWQGWNVTRQLFYPEHETVADVRFWSAQVYALTLLLGLPVAFLIWHWRDVNVRDQIATSRKDINLKEFQEVQLRAAGALAVDLPLEAREQLQIAALHQLRGFLKGDYGPEFKRPAFELLLAGHAAAIERIGLKDVQSNASKITYQEMRMQISSAREKLNFVDSMRMSIIKDESKYIFCITQSIKGYRFDLINFEGKSFPEKIDLRGCHFCGSNLSLVTLENANLSGPHFEGATLHNSIFKYSAFVGAYFEHSLFSDSRLDFADLRTGNLLQTSFHRAHLEGAFMAPFKYDGALFEGAFFNDETRLDGNWSDRSPQQKAELQEQLIVQRAINVDRL